jgi:hypothetical protein
MTAVRELFSPASRRSRITAQIPSRRTRSAIVLQRIRKAAMWLRYLLIPGDLREAHAL